MLTFLNVERPRIAKRVVVTAGVLVLTQLCDFGQAVSLLWASVSSCVRWSYLNNWSLRFLLRITLGFQELD